MATEYSIRKKLPEYGVDDVKVKEIMGNGELTGVIMRMDELLDPEITQQLLDSCGCLGSREYRKKLEKMGKELAGKSLEEKISHINSAGTGAESIHINDDGSLTAVLRFGGGEYCGCACSAAVKKGVKVADLTAAEGPVMPLTYCYCCAGSMRRHLQLQLCAELRTKEIVSSPINSRGEKPCEFVYVFAD